ncbi:unnamed protein product [Darwinula stevensoni]|uniref:Uncharacterized protein n=1 Tax=Darwinula stevensoni TaxID=69355 RepID=A0A7R8X127_9CRUS|nr:unnamed protein product [Darwinula stevensoni]CAG0881812.1 unnamed protein product [Darwinula stevensoni]
MHRILKSPWRDSFGECLGLRLRCTDRPFLPFTARPHGAAAPSPFALTSPFPRILLPSFLPSLLEDHVNGMPNASGTSGTRGSGGGNGPGLNGPIGSAGPVDASHQPMVGVARLLDDLRRLADDRETADLLFLLGREETHLHGHRLIFTTRCKSFQNLKRGEVCKIPGCSVGVPQGNVTPIRLPQFHPDNFRQVLLYIYTGKILMSDSTVFEVLSIAQDLGLEELRQMAEDHVASTLNPNNACTFMAAAVAIEDRTSGSKGSKSFVERCIAYIGENAAECVHTNAFLSLSKDALIRLISSDNLALEEEEVWRAVLSWSKHQAKVTQPTAHWTEEERSHVCHHLAGVINHVRLLLIDSQVFAEEVEPTGAVPMELSLERYRAAALPQKFNEAPQQDRRLQPRSAAKFFPGSQILAGEEKGFQRLLNQWYGEPRTTWRLLFRASSHGYSAHAFHRCCDGVAPTYVLVLGPRGEICGGFSDVPWGQTSSKGRFLASDRAFLFTLENGPEIPPTKFDVVKRTFAIAHHPDFGPIFGAGADLSISDCCNMNCESYSNLPHSYDGENASCTLLMGNYNFNVLEYEIFTPVALKNTRSWESFAIALGKSSPSDLSMRNRFYSLSKKMGFSSSNIGVTLDTGQSCPVGWEQFANNCYFFEADNSRKYLFDDARLRCLEVESELASVHNQQESDFIARNVKAAYNFLGGVVTGDLTLDPLDFQWVDGTPSDFHDFSNQFLDFGSNLVIMIDRWENEDCTERMASLCELPILDEMDCSLAWELVGGRHCYYVDDELLTFTASRLACSNFEAESDLAVFETEEEYFEFLKFVLERSSSERSRFWIGLQRFNETWLWSDGSTPQLDHWNDGYPQPDRGECGAVVASSWATTKIWSYGNQSQQYCLRWNSFSATFLSTFEELQQLESLCDATLFCEGHIVRVHRLVLSACSPHFRKIFEHTSSINSGDSVVILDGTRYEELKLLVQFMYKGEVHLTEEQLQPLLKTAERLQIRGLMDVAQKSSIQVPRSNYVVHDPFKRKKPVAVASARKAEDRSNSSITGNAAEERLNGVTDKVDSGSEVTDDSPSKKESDLDRDKDEENSEDGDFNHCGVTSYVKEDHGYFKEDGVESEVEMEIEGDGEIEENDATTVHEAVEAGVSQVVSALALPGTSSSTPVRSPYKHCVTDSSTGQKIPRPPNAFMIFANEWRKNLASEYPSESNKEISIRLGTIWKKLSAETKQKYYDLAREAGDKHKEKYPYYVYNPKEARIRKQLRYQAKYEPKFVPIISVQSEPSDCSDMYSS